MKSLGFVPVDKEGRVLSGYSRRSPTIFLTRNLAVALTRGAVDAKEVFIRDE